MRLGQCGSTLRVGICSKQYALCSSHLEFLVVELTESFDSPVEFGWPKVSATSATIETLRF